ncbi:uncharacterized protein LOC125943597 [Dermacentor silvarum]|uniref:uncharacterized protein LOC125943597 n=1 Tax=Dermacentor silvarum TaxID=543639 RepID=UPI0021015779|nr:uncharacterized protein LOC125943597 [Dermacentor silvarum]
MSEADRNKHIMKGINDDAFQMLLAKNPNSVADVITLCHSYGELRKQQALTRPSPATDASIASLAIGSDQASLLTQIKAFVRKEVARQLSLVPFTQIGVRMSESAGQADPGRDSYSGPFQQSRHARVQAVRREKWQPSDSSRICGLHFITGAPSPFPNHPDWAPNVFAFKKANREAEEKKCDRYERTLKRKRCSASNHGSAAHTGCVVAAYAAYASRDKANAEAESDGDAVASTLFWGDIEPDPTESDGDAVTSTLFLGDIEPDPTESDGDAVTSTLFLGDIEPDPTDGEDEMEPDSTDDEASNDLPESMQLLQAQLPAPSHHMGGFSRNLQARMQEKYPEKCRAYNALQERYLIMEN